MTKEEIQEQIDALRAQLSGDLSKDILFLNQEAQRYAADRSKAGLVRAISELAVELFPEADKQFMKKTLYVGERRLDAIFAEASVLMQQKHYDKALVLTGQIYDKIKECFGETIEKRYFSFRNPFESNLYYSMYHPSKTLERAPFDFPKFLMAHAYNLIEERKLKEAIPVLEEAIRYNPVNPDPRFELAEVYKLTHEDEMLLAVIRETLPIAATPYALSRCYANMGYYCVEVRDYPRAICFYFESLIYAEHPGIIGELRHVSSLMGKKIEPPKRQEVLDAFAHYDMPNGADTNVLGIAHTLGEQSVEKNDWQMARFYWQIMADLTNNETYKELLAQAKKELGEEDTPKV